MMSKEIYVGGRKYTIYSDGTIYGVSGNLLKQRPNPDGYATVTLGDGKQRKNYSVHRLVAEYFLPNPNNLTDVDHLDGNRMNPRVENLEWVSHQENISRAKARGSYNGRYVGEKNPKARLTEEIVLKLRAEYAQGVTIQEMVKKYGFAWNTIGNAVKGYTWAHL